MENETLSTQHTTKAINDERIVAAKGEIPNDNNETTTNIVEILIEPPDDGRGGAQYNQETDQMAMVGELRSSSEAIEAAPPPPQSTLAKHTQLLNTLNIRRKTMHDETSDYALMPPPPPSSSQQAHNSDGQHHQFVAPVVPPTRIAAIRTTTPQTGATAATTLTEQKQKRAGKVMDVMRREGESSCPTEIDIIVTGEEGAAATATDSAGCGSEEGAGGGGGSAGVTSNIKTSLSMTSLPPNDEQQQESRDVIKAKLRVERPYNSLKKNVDRNIGGVNYGTSYGSKQHHRYSWGSGQSSSSLHSSATTGLGSGKDDLWAAIQTNYDYIMDTNLLDTCKEARCELEGAASVEQSPTGCCQKMLDETKRTTGSYEDLKELRKWLRDMEQQLDNAPSLLQTTRLSIGELQRHLVNYSLLYQEIGSHTRVVNTCIRVATEREQQRLQQQQWQASLLQQAAPEYDCLAAEQNASSLSSTDETISTSVTTTTTTTATPPPATAGTAAAALSVGDNSQSSGIGTAATVDFAEGSKSTADSSGSNTTRPAVTGTAAAASIGLTSTPKSSASATAAATTTRSTDSVSTSTSSSQKGEWNVEHLLERYHLVYLKALEVQLWLDSLLRKKTSTAALFLTDEVDRDDYSSECCDDIGNATEDDLRDVASELESDYTQTHSDLDEFDREEEQEEENENEECARGRRTRTPDRLQHTPTVAHVAGECIEKVECADGDDEGEEDEEEEEYGNDDEEEIAGHGPNYQRNWLRRRAVAQLCGRGGSFVANFDRATPPTRACRAIAGATLTDFEADSESSDLEAACNSRRHRKGHSGYGQPTTTPLHLTQQEVANVVDIATPATLPSATPHVVALNMVADNCDVSPALAAAPSHQANRSVGSAATDAAVEASIEEAVDGMFWLFSPSAASPPPPRPRSAATAAAPVAAASDDVVDSHQSAPIACNGSGKVPVVATTASAATQTLATPATTTVLASAKLHALNGHGGGGSGGVGGIVVGRNNNRAKTIAVISPNTHNNNSNCSGTNSNGYNHSGRHGDAGSPTKSPIGLRKRQQQQRHADISKFNRSNRKSKNCAIFYFKHMDTDNDETTSTTYGSGSTGGADADAGLSSSASHASDLLKSVEASTDEEDDCWMYSSSAVQQTQTASGATIIHSVAATLNSNGGGASAEGLQSATITSTTGGQVVGRSDLCTAAAGSAASTIISDDSDKENKATAEASAAAAAAEGLPTTFTNHRSISIGGGVAIVCATAATTTAAIALNSTQIAVAEIALASPMHSQPQAAQPAAAFMNGHSSGSLSSNTSCSSNDILTETTTSATNTTQITRMAHSRQQQQQHQQTEVGMKGRRVGPGGFVAATLPNPNSAANNDYGSNGAPNSAVANNNKNNNRQNATTLNGHEADAHGNSQKETMRYYTRADICNISASAGPLQQHPLLGGKHLPPRSPAKSSTSHRSHGSRSSLPSPTKGKVSHESIKQLVLEAEHLVRDEALKTPTRPQRSKHSLVKISSTVRKREIIMSGPIKQRVQEWLEHQPTSPAAGQSNDFANNNNNSNSGGGSNGHNGSARVDDCEASGEASETDSIPQPGSDTSEGFTDSIATCMQTSTTSYGNSTERIGGSAEPISGTNSTAQVGSGGGGVVGGGYGSSNQSLNAKIVKRPQTVRRKSERPWSVSCLSQLTTEAAHTTSVAVAKVSDVQAGLASHSISESALDSLSPSRPRASSSSTSQIAVPGKSYDNKGSLKRRRTRKKKHSQASTSTTVATRSVGKKTDSGSEETAEMPKLTQTLLMKSCESMTAQQIQDITNALLSLQKNAASSAGELINGATGGSQSLLSLGQGLPQQLQSALNGLRDSDEEAQLMKPIFRVGSVATSFMRNEERLGSLAALATYMNDEDEQQGEYTTGTDDHHSSFSETAWDNYQEKYSSENYSEGFDSDTARRLMEFGDDYRNFIDSQSDCCSSLSAANNLDSLSPPRMDSLQQNEAKTITQDHIASSVDHARRRRALELEYERRRKTLEVRRKSCQDSSDNPDSPRSSSIPLSASASALTAKGGQPKTDSSNRKLEFSGMSHSAQSLRRTSESDTSTRRRKADERRRSSRNLEKYIKQIPATSSSSGDDSDEEKEMRNLLLQNRTRLEDTRALKIRCHLLRPEDYAEIINTCRDNIRCLEAVLRGPPATVLSTPCIAQTKDLLAAWEDLLGWSQNAAAARKMQEEMVILKHTLNRLGNKATYELLDTEPSIQIAIEALKSEKIQLQTYRTSMLRLNASVHSWLAKQEQRLERALAEQQEQQRDPEQPAASKSTINAESEQQTQAALSGTSHNSDSNSSGGGRTSTVSAATNTAVAPTYSAVAAGAVAAAGGEKLWDLGTLMTSEQEFHKHLKDEVGDMYSAWDEADARINSQLEVLTNSLVAWRLLESGLLEFQQALGQDRGTLKGLEGALDRGQATPLEMAQNVKLVAKLLSEKVNVSQEQLTAVQQHLDPNHILHIAKFTASCGSLSDSGISDGGATSDGGLSERERRLGVLRRLAKQLESALAPGSEAMKSIAARMESAEAELKNLQITCRDLIVRTAASHQSKQQQQQLDGEAQLEQVETTATVAAAATATRETAKCNGNGYIHTNGHAVSNRKTTAAAVENGKLLQQDTVNTSHKSKRRQRKGSSGSNSAADATETALAIERDAKLTASAKLADKSTKGQGLSSPDSGDPYDDPSLTSDLEPSDDDDTPKKGWGWRIARAAVPVQLALITIYCAACMMQPNCCDNLNNLSMSFTPQLRYIRGPPPI